PLGKYIAKVYQGDNTLLDPVFGPIERICEKISGLDLKTEMNWKQQMGALLTINMLWFLIGMAILMVQGNLPLNPDNTAGMSADLGLESVISYVVTCDLEDYSGDSG